MVSQFPHDKHDCSETRGGNEEFGDQDGHDKVAHYWSRVFSVMKSEVSHGELTHSELSTIKSELLR